jgi:hypothetical protein
MCRNIRTLHNFDPPATTEETHASALQYVRKISGSTKPSQANEAAFEEAVAEVEAATRKLLDHLVTTAPPKNREAEAAKAKAPLRKTLRRRLDDSAGAGCRLNPWNRSARRFIPRLGDVWDGRGPSYVEGPNRAAVLVVAIAPTKLAAWGWPLDNTHGSVDFAGSSPVPIPDA